MDISCTNKLAARMPKIRIYYNHFLKPYIFKMWKVHRKLNTPNIFRLTAIYTWATAFKILLVRRTWEIEYINKICYLNFFVKKYFFTYITDILFYNIRNNHKSKLFHANTNTFQAAMDFAYTYELLAFCILFFLYKWL